MKQIEIENLERYAKIVEENLIINLKQINEETNTNAMGQKSIDRERIRYKKRSA
jgi:hypothetical protein